MRILAVFHHFKPKVESRSVALAIERLKAAGRDRAFADRKAATDQVMIVLRARAVS